MTAANPLRLLLLMVLAGCALQSPDSAVDVIEAEATPTTAVASDATRAAHERCEGLEACIARLRFLALKSDQYNSLGPEDQALIARIITLEGATPRLVALLADPEPDVAELAAAALSDVPNVDPVYLPQVKAGLDRKLGWLPRVLGHMDSDEAAREAVARYLVSEDAPENQENFAVQLSGRRAIPWIVRHARCRPACAKDDIYLLGSAIEEMGHERAEAAPALMAIAEARNSSTGVAQGALSLVAALGTDGLGVEARLLALADNHPELKQSVDRALIGIHSEHAGDLFAQSLSRHADAVVLRDLAILGRAGRSAGPKVVELLNGPDWELRIAAATTLGEIGYEPATESLIEAAQNNTDVRLQWVAMRALGRLRAADARPALALMARSHWYLPVREAAVAALHELPSPPPAPDGDNAERRSINRFWAWWYMGSTAPKCEHPAVKTSKVPGTLNGSADVDRMQLESLAYVQPERYPPPPPPPEPGTATLAKPTPPPPQMRAPDVALRLDNGWLVGSDDGEWGGELMFIDDAKHAQVIAIQNIQGMHRLGSRVVVLSGLAHMSNYGAAYELVRRGKGWQLQPWRGLPAAPARSSMTTSGELLVQTTGGGSILIAPDGTMRAAPCET